MEEADPWCPIAGGNRSTRGRQYDPASQGKNLLDTSQQRGLAFRVFLTAMFLIAQG
jgi:hypothetical protein